MKKIRSILIFGVFILAACLNTHGQVQAAKDAMESLYTTYDSSQYLTFDVVYTYSTDTAYGEFQHDVLKGSYTMNGAKAKFNLGDYIEYMQNDSLFIAVYKNEKMIVVDRPRNENAGGLMPMRGAIDSVLEVYASHYSISVLNDISDSIGYITFERIDSLAPYDKFVINFDPQQKFLTGLVYEYQEDEVHYSQVDSIDVEQIYHFKKKMKIDFVNYRFDNFDPEIYNDNSYIWFEDGEAKPISKFEGYRVFDSR